LTRSTADDIFVRKKFNIAPMPPPPSHPRDHVSVHQKKVETHVQENIDKHSRDLKKETHFFSILKQIEYVSSPEITFFMTKQEIYISKTHS
jgi:hypothetical protein